MNLQSCGLTMSRPKLEMSLASAAFIAAKEVNARVLSPNYFRKAEVYFLKAKSAYKRKYFNQAQKYALLSKEYSERAEYDAIKQSVVGKPQPQ